MFEKKCVRSHPVASRIVFQKYHHCVSSRFLIIRTQSRPPRPVVKDNTISSRHETVSYRKLLSRPVKKIDVSRRKPSSRPARQTLPSGNKPSRPVETFCLFFLLVASLLLPAWIFSRGKKKYTLPHPAPSRVFVASVKHTTSK